VLRPSNRAVRFVRALVAGATARRSAEVFAAKVPGAGTATLEAAEARELIAAGVLSGDGSVCRATAEARSWLRRALATEGDAFGAQHRVEALGRDGATLNLAESPLVRLAAPGAAASAFLSAHHVEAGERVRRLVERARLQPRVTMSYDPAHMKGGKGTSKVADLTETAAGARQALNRIAEILPRDCHAVVIDVCGFLKGLQLVESERGWPRRSAKLVLRIGLDQLARHFGIDEAATGVATGRRRAWMEEGARPTEFG
jgi:hypothetical protein